MFDSQPQTVTIEGRNPAEERTILIKRVFLTIGAMIIAGLIMIFGLRDSVLQWPLVGLTLVLFTVRIFWLVKQGVRVVKFSHYS